MRYFFDTEFLEDGPDKPVRLISIGIVAEDGRRFYAENRDIDLASLPEWLQKNVVPHLVGPDHHSSMSLNEIRAELLNWLGNDDNPQFWAYFGAYDWVCFCQLFGRMIDLPKNFPMFVRDIQIVRMQLGGVKLPEHTGTAHNALSDAEWTRDAFNFLHDLAEEYNAIFLFR